MLKKDLSSVDAEPPSRVRAKSTNFLVLPTPTGYLQPSKMKRQHIGDARIGQYASTSRPGRGRPEVLDLEKLFDEAARS